MTVLGPAIGRLLDRLYRPFGLGLMMLLQGMAISISGMLVLAMAANPAVPFIDSPLFPAVLVLSMVERLTAVSSEMEVERFWVTQLSGKDNAVVLARSNATLRRTDLGCELIGSLAFGWLYSQAGLAASLGAMILVTAVSLPIEGYLIWKVNLFGGKVGERADSNGAPLMC